jgi:glycosyltransferase involved in cell wall biosynthesis
MGQPAPLRIAFITSTPLNAREGSGTFVGIQTLAGSLARLGVQVDIVAPHWRLPVLTANRLLFNAWLPFGRWNDYDVIVGFDLDGYRIAGRTGRPHVAAIKGVIADELLHERGLTRATMSLQARWEAYHVHHADRVIATSRYSAERLIAFYNLKREPAIIPELIDVSAWRERFARLRIAPDASRFVVLCVCRFYRRKRVDLLLRAAAQLKARIPQLEVRIAGDGPEQGTLERLARSLQLSSTVRWLGSLDTEQLAREYSGSDVFCLPSVQEGFGIVLLEAMAAEKPVIAARAAAIPEVVPHALLVAPEDSQALARGIESLYQQPELRRTIAAAGSAAVEKFDAPRVAGQFLAELERLANRKTNAAETTTGTAQTTTLRA